jgi:hypothetical protein
MPPETDKEKKILHIFTFLMTFEIHKKSFMYYSQIYACLLA